MVKGLDKFAAHFAGDQGRYALIGGVATQLTLDEAGLESRATKDLDIVLCVEALDAGFGEKMWQFIEAGGYQVREHSTGERQFHRFAKPTDPSYPHMLEFFARQPGYLPLADGTHLTPVPFDQQVESLSAILLDQDYYDFLQAHTVELHGVRLVTHLALIPLKARAWLDLTARKAAEPDNVDSRNISKHCKDVLRLSQLLTDEDRLAVPAAIRADVAAFLAQVAPSVTEELLKDLKLEGTPAALLSRLRNNFGVEA